MVDVFISYKREERHAVEQIAARLQELGLTVWFDSRLTAGETFNDEIDREARGAKSILVCWSPTAQRSRWVKAEALIGFDHDKLAACRVSGPNDFSPPTPFNTIHAEDLRAWLDSPNDAHAGWKNILYRIGRLCGRNDIEAWAALGPSPGLECEVEHHFDELGRRDAERRAREAAEVESRRRADEEQRARVAARARAGSVWRDAIPGLAESASPEMVTIPPGKLLMGAPAGEEGSSDAEHPQHEVRIDYAFALGKHAVTFAEWDAAIAAGAKLEKPGDQGWGRDRRPVINVNWNDAKAYIAWLNSKLGLEGRADAYRLPSEAEWEYACRAGTTTPFSFGATISTAQANYNGEYTYGAGKKGEKRGKTTPVGSFPANFFGLHDMHGNVWEWCEDAWNANYHGAPTDGSAWLTGDASSRVLRGGSWGDFPRGLRSAFRGGSNPTYRNYFLGFRVARTL